MRSIWRYGTLKVKHLGVPVYELLGGKSHDKIRMYANGWPRKNNTPEGIAEGVKRVVDQGYEALKFYPFRGTQVAKIDRIQHGVALGGSSARNGRIAN